MDGAGFVLLGGLHDGITERNLEKGVVYAITGDENRTTGFQMMGATTKQAEEMQRTGRGDEQIPLLSYVRTDPDEFDSDGRTIYRFIPS